jgi:hypothetical protein
MLPRFLDLPVRAGMRVHHAHRPRRLDDDGIVADEDQQARSASTWRRGRAISA